MVTVLTIDDNVDVRALIHTLLLQLGCHALVATNGREGVALALRVRPDLVLIDSIADYLNGYDVSIYLRFAGFGGRIVLMSLNPTVLGKRNARECGADDYVRKPLTSRAIQDQLVVLRL